MAIRVYNGINARYPEKLTLIDLFAYPTIAQLAGQLREKLGRQKEPILTPPSARPNITLEDVQRMSDQDVDRFLDEEE